MTTQPDLDTLVPWSEWRKLDTSRGVPVMLRKTNPKHWQPDSAFWEVWRNQKDFMKANGVALGRDYKDQTLWEVKQWREIPATELARLNASIQASQAVSTDQPVPCPEGLEYFGFQKAGVAFCRGRDGVLIGDEMGLGKTVQAIGVMNDDTTINRVLIVCPASLKINWYRELQRWLMRPLKAWIADPNFFPSTDIVIINDDILHKYPGQLAKGFDLLVADECHRFKDRKARRSKILFTIPARRRLGLSGTPIVNRPEELFSIVNWLDPKEYPSWWSFTNRYTGSGERLKLLHTKLRSTLMVRRMKRDVLTELPAKLRVVIEIEAPELKRIAGHQATLGASHEDRLERLQAALELAKVSEREQDYREAVQALSEACRVAFEDMAAVRVELARAKIPYLIQHLAGLVEQGVKVIHFAHHREVIEAIHAAFPEQAVIHYGGMKDQDKQDSVDRFQRDPNVLVFSGSLKASGVGITLTASSHVVFGEQDWVPGVMTQAEDRAHRIGQRESVTVQHLVAKDTLDSNMARTCVDKQGVIDQALDQDRQSLSIEPSAPLVRSAGHVSVARREIAEKALTMSREHIVVVHRCLAILAGVCDGARQRDGHGFNGVDAAIGKSLAEQHTLTAKQSILGLRIVRKYKRQIPEDLFNLLP